MPTGFDLTRRNVSRKNPEKNPVPHNGCHFLSFTDFIPNDLFMLHLNSPREVLTFRKKERKKEREKARKKSERREREREKKEDGAIFPTNPPATSPSFDVF